MAAAPFVRFNGLRLWVSVRGEGRPVLLINGLGASLAMWAALQEDLDGLEVISYDAPGTGRSPTPLWPYTMGELARVARGLLDELGHDEVDVVGYSLGGLVAQELALRAPERVRRLVLAGTTCGLGAVPGPLSAILAVVTPIRYYSKLAYAVTTPLMAGGGAERDPAFIERTTAARLHSPPSLPGYALQLAAAWTCSTLPRLHRIDHPTLVLAGAEDRLVPPANGALLAAHLANARLLICPGWGHYFLQDHRSGAGEAIADFLRAPAPESSRPWRAGSTVGREELAAAVRETRGVAQPAGQLNGLIRSVFAPRAR